LCIDDPPNQSPKRERGVEAEVQAVGPRGISIANREAEHLEDTHYNVVPI
jgi:hypothetical protein